MIDDEDMNNKLVQQIDIQGDSMKQKSNVKAQMTEWEMWNKPGFNTFAHYYVDVAHHITTRDYRFKCELKHIKLSCLWGMKYLSDDYAIEHDHWPATFGCVYYINPPKDCPGLYFKELDLLLINVWLLILICEPFISSEILMPGFNLNFKTPFALIALVGLCPLILA